MKAVVKDKDAKKKEKDVEKDKVAEERHVLRE